MIVKNEQPRRTVSRPALSPAAAAVFSARARRGRATGLSGSAVMVFLLAAALVFVSCASPPAAGKGGADGPAHVWKVTKENGVLYIGGTIHLLRARDYPLPPDYDRAFGLAGALVFETDMDALEDPASRELIKRNSGLPPGQTLKTVLAPEVFELFAGTCRKYGVQAGMFARLKPGIAVNALALVAIMQTGFREKGIDDYYNRLAKKEGRKVYYLETTEFQIDTLANIGAGYENEYVRYSLRDFKNLGKAMREEVDAWRNCDIAYQTEGLAEINRVFPKVYNAVIKERNEAWLPLLSAFLETPEVEFVLAGAAHLHGPDGVLTLLEKSGCAVQPLR